jgi:hypothetical protein
MTDHRTPAVIDPHSHTELPPEPRAYAYPPAMLQTADGNVTNLGAAIYAAHEFRRRWYETDDYSAHADYLRALQELGGLAYWSLCITMDILR